MYVFRLEKMFDKSLPAVVHKPGDGSGRGAQQGVECMQEEDGWLEEETTKLYNLYKYKKELADALMFIFISLKSIF